MHACMHACKREKALVHSCLLYGPRKLCVFSQWYDDSTLEPQCSYVVGASVCFQKGVVATTGLSTSCFTQQTQAAWQRQRGSLMLLPCSS